MIIIVIICGLVLSGAIGYFLFTTAFDILIGNKIDSPDKSYIDNSVHYHQHLTVVKKDETIVETRTEIKDGKD